MEAEVKERLVGAIILVLLAVLVVPALLSGPKQPEPVEPHGPAASRSVDIELNGTRADDSVEIATPGEQDVPEPAVVREAPTGVPDGDKPAQAPPAQAVAPAVASAPVRLPDAAPAGAGWAVQVAALSSPDAAAKRVAELRRRGYSAFSTEYRSGGRVLHRVRIGPEATRDRAVALAARLKADGVEGNVVSHP